jgi:hypothetical protein
MTDEQIRKPAIYITIILVLILAYSMLSKWELDSASEKISAEAPQDSLHSIDQVRRELDDTGLDQKTDSIVIDDEASNKMKDNTGL